MRGGSISTVGRICWLRRAPGRHYLFDVFYVNGGRQHDYMLHGNQAEFDCRPALGPVRESGTLAGEDVALRAVLRRS